MLGNEISPQRKEGESDNKDTGRIWAHEEEYYGKPRLWIEKTNVLVDIETEISRNLKGLGAIEIANAVRKKSLAGVETAMRVFETQPRRERDPDR